MIESVVCIRPICRWPCKIARLGATVRVLQRNSVGDGQNFRELVEVDATRTNAEAVLNEIRTDPNVQEVVILGHYGNSLFVSIRGVNCKPCMAATAPTQRCYLTSTVVNEQGEMEMSFISGGKGSLRRMLSVLKKTKVSVHLKRISTVNGKGGLTIRQEHVIRYAMRSGYFDYPRKVTLERLASMLNVSPSTISEILRRVERKIFEAYFKEAVPKSRHRESQPQKAESTEILYRELRYLTTLGS